MSDTIRILGVNAFDHLHKTVLSILADGDLDDLPIARAVLALYPDLRALVLAQLAKDLAGTPAAADLAQLG